MTIGDVYSALWRHRLFILLSTAALVAVTWVLTERQTKQYTASTLVRVQQTVTTQDEVFGALQTGERLARTYAIIAGTSAITDEVDGLLGGRVPRDQLRVKAEQVDNLELLRLSVTNPSPAVAARIANAVPNALSTFIDGKGSLRDEIITVEPASVPTSPSSPNLKLNVAIALLLGLILNAALALLIDALSDKAGDPRDFERVFGYPVIATFPKLKFSPARQGPGEEDALLSEPPMRRVATRSGAERSVRT